MKNFFSKIRPALLAILILPLFFSSCVAFKPETKRTLRDVTGIFIETSLDFAAFKLQKEVKPITIPLFEDANGLVFMDRNQCLKIEKTFTSDSVYLEISPIWLNARDWITQETITASKTQSDYVKALISSTMNYAVYRASEVVKPFKIRLARSELDNARFRSKHGVLLISFNSNAVTVEADLFRFSNIIKSFAREKIFKEKNADLLTKAG